MGENSIRFPSALGRVGASAWAGLALACCLVFVPRGTAAQSNVERIYLANDDHTDYYWSATGDEYRVAFLDMLDYYLDLTEATAGLPPDQRSRFNCDGSLWVREYEQNRTPQQMQRLISQIQDGSISVPYHSLVLLPGAMPAEAFLRDMYYAGSLERRYGLDLDLAGALENQTLAAGAASLWAGAGARYSWYGICGCATQTQLGFRDDEIYAFQGKDGQSVTLKWNSFFDGLSTSIGGYAEARDPAAAVDLIENDPDYVARWPYRVAGAFGHGWDDLSSKTDVMVQASATLSRPDLRVIVSNEIDFFEDFLAEHRTELPTFSGSFGNEWDLLTASLAGPTARLRRAVERLRTAEALAASMWFTDPQIWTSRQAQRESAYFAMGLYYEHAWTADGPVSRFVREQWQRDLVAEVETYVDGMLGESLTALANRVPTPASSGQPYVIFNPLAWTRDDVVDLGAGVERPVHVVDAESGAELRSQWITRDGVTTLRVKVDAVPSLGYRVVQLREGNGASFSDAATVNGSEMENARWRLRLESDGRLSSLVDKAAASRELAGPAGLNRLNVTQAGSFSVESIGPVSVVLRADAQGSPAHVTRVTLHEGIDRIDVENRITQNFGGTVGFDYDFALDGSTGRHEELGTISILARKAAGGDYADTNTRTDYLSVNHFFDFSESGYGVTVSDPDASYFRLGDSTINSLDTSQSKVRSIVGMQVDGPGFGFIDQGGDSDFLQRYAITAHGGFDAANAMRFSLEHQNPLVGVALSPSTDGSMPASPSSLIEIDQNEVLAWVVKPAEDPAGGALVVRAWNLAETSRFFEVSVPDRTMADGSQVTHVEAHPTPAGVGLNTLFAALSGQGMGTWQLDVEPAPTAAPPSSPGARVQLQAHPNPFNPRVQLGYALTKPSPVQLRIYDAAGRLVRELEHRVQPAGQHTLVWEGTDTSGQPVASGVYHAHLLTGEGSSSTKLTLAR